MVSLRSIFVNYDNIVLFICYVVFEIVSVGFLLDTSGGVLWRKSKAGFAKVD